VRAAEHLRIPDLPLVVPPHPLYDLPEEELREVARKACPLLVAQLTELSRHPRIARVDYRHP
jgi:hypothetical protein